jgi:uncharacterized protein (TIGR03437 family)
VGAVAAFQLISIFGAKLGTDTSGVSVTFDGNPAPLLYVSESQINVAVLAPPLNRAVAPLAPAMVMQVTVNGVSIQRQFPFTLSNLNLFADLSSNEITCPSAGFDANGFQPLAENADGSVNSCTNPAKYGSTISFFMHGTGGVALGTPPPSQLPKLQANVGFCSAAIANMSLVTGFVYKIDVAMPASQLLCADDYSLSEAETSFPVTFSYNGLPVGPLVVPNGGPIINFAPGVPMPMIVWVTR